MEDNDFERLCEIMAYYLIDNMNDLCTRSLIVDKENQPGQFAITCRYGSRAARIFMPIDPFWPLSKSIEEVDKEFAIPGDLEVPMYDIIKKYLSDRK